MTPENWKRVHEHLKTACEELFAANGIPLQTVAEPTEERSNEEKVVAFIGFSGQQLYGHLTVFLPSEILWRSHPLGDRAIRSDDSLCDWAREISNQLVGRLKNRLLSSGVLLMLSTPSAAIGRQLRGNDEREEGFFCAAFRSEGEEVLLTFDANAVEGVELSEPDEGATAGQSEGDLLLF